MLASVTDRQNALQKRYPQWQPRTLDQMLDTVAKAFPDRPYVITDARTYSYSDIQQWSRRIAGGLSACGVKAGEHVAFILANYPEFVAVKYAIARLGAVAVPINFWNRRDELGYVLEQSDSVALITMDRFRDLDYLGALDDLAPGWETHGGGQRLPELRHVFVFSTSGLGARSGATSLEELAATSAASWQPFGQADPESTADILYTSGTTGNPKGVLITHEMLLRTAYSSAYGRAFQDGRRILFSLPMYHVFGYVEGMLPVLFVGGAIIPQLNFEPHTTLRGIERHRADDALLIPTMTLAVLDAVREKTYDLSSLTAVLSSGGAAPKRIWTEIFKWLQPEEVTTGYGMTEATASTTVTRPDDPIERLQTTNGRLRDAGVAGSADLGGKLVAYRVVDAGSGDPVATGAVGEFLIKGPGVTPGYYNKPQATAEAFDEHGWMRTGDLGRLDDDEYISLVGRKKESYRCGGEQVMPTEIEQVLSEHPAVAQAYIVPLPDERMGEVGVAYVIFNENSVAEAAELIDFCSQRLAKFKVPKHVLSITQQELPTTSTGRPRRFLLVERAVKELTPA